MPSGIAPLRRLNLPGHRSGHSPATPRLTGAEAGFVARYSREVFPFLLAIFLFRSYVAEPFEIPSSSMRPGLSVGDFILVNKFTYGLRLPLKNTVLVPVNDVQRGDVVVFKFPLNPRIDYVKRVVGLPGDIVDFHAKRLTINGQPIKDVGDGAYEYVERQIALIHNNQYLETIGNKSFNVITIPDAPPLVIQQVLNFPDRSQCRYDEDGFACKVPPGKYFMMGDNRDNSFDSRYWGFVNDNQIVGKAFFVWLNLSNPMRIGTIIH